jgi:hypothetical protein
VTYKGITSRDGQVKGLLHAQLGAVLRILVVVIGRWKRAIFVEAGRKMSR